MSDQILGEVIVLMHDPAFADAVRNDPARVLAPFQLSAEEIEHVLALVPDHEAGVKQLSVRASKSALFFNTGLQDASSVAASAHHHAAASIPTHGATIGEQAYAWVQNMDAGYDEAGPNAVQGIDVARSSAASELTAAAEEEEESPPI